MPRIVRSGRWLLLTLALGLAPLLFPTVSGAQTEAGAADTQRGHPIWDATVSAILGPQPEQAPMVQGAQMHTGILGWDKATGQPLDDPTLTRSDRTSPEIRVVEEAKTAQLDTSTLTYRSGLQQQVVSGIDRAWATALRAAPANAAVPEPHYGVIVFPLPFPTEARVALEQAGVVFYTTVEGGGLYARVPAGALTALERLTGAGQVRAAGPIPAAARLDRALADRAATSPDASVEVTLQFFDVPDKAQLEAVSQWLTIKDESLHPALPMVQGALRAGDASFLVALPFVRWLELDIPATTGNLESTMALTTDVLRAGNSGSTGTGVQVAVMDTGIATPAHTDLPTTRVDDQWEFYPGNDAVADDTGGHGTHVAGTIGGLGTNSESLQGHAPGSRLLIYKLCCNASNTGFGSTVFQNSLIRAGNNGADISNNSWGGGNGVYNTSAEVADRAVRGEYGNRYLNMVIISHNDNNLIRSPGTAKNAITVGAVKDGNWPNTTFTWGCSDTNWPPAERVCFSNYGPINIDGDGASRVKPDLMAPGVRIRSTVLGDTYADYDGTSMAAPGVSGAIAALLSHYAASNDWLFSWPETIKALMLSSAVDVGGNTALYGRGMPDVYHAAYFQPGVTMAGRFWGQTIAATGNTMDFAFDVPAGYNSVRVALTWPDPAGSAEVSNDLDLYVYADSTCSGSVVGTATSLDDTVEFVRVAAGQPGGTWCARVRGYSLSSSQTFGLSVSGTLAPAAINAAVSVDTSTVAPNEYIYFYTTIYSNGDTANGTYARLLVPTGFTVVGARVYSADGRSYFYDAANLYQGSDGYWRVAVGAALRGYPRVVRWFIQANPNVANGPLPFQTTAFFRQSGTLTQAINDNTTSVRIINACPHFVAPATVTVHDLVAITDKWLTFSGGPAWEVRFDMDGDDNIDVVDIMRTTNRWGAVCPS